MTLIKPMDWTKEEREELVKNYLKMTLEEFKEECEDWLIDYKAALTYCKKIAKKWEK